MIRTHKWYKWKSYFVGEDDKNGQVFYVFEKYKDYNVDKTEYLVFYKIYYPKSRMSFSHHKTMFEDSSNYEELDTGEEWCMSYTIQQEMNL